MNLQVEAMVAPTATTVFMTNIIINLWSKSIEVRFDTAEYDYSNYSIEVWNQTCDSKSGDLVYQDTAVGVKHVTSTFITGFFDPGDYCIQVTPYNVSRGGNCHSGCNTVKKDVYLNYTDTLSCKTWNTYITLEPSPHQNDLYSSFSMDPNACFSGLLYWQLSLFKVITQANDCRNFSDLEGVENNVKPPMGSGVKFKNLVPGRYCVRLLGYHRSCSGFCEARYSSIINLNGERLAVEEPEVRTSIKNEPDTSPGLTWLYVAFPCCAAVFLFLGFFVYRRKRKARTYGYPADGFEIINQEDDIYMLEQKVKAVTEIKEVVLVLFHDFDKHDAFINTFFTFLKDLLKFSKVRLDLNEEDEIPVNPAGWVDEVTKEKENRCYIILESEDAIKRVNEMNQLEEPIKEEDDYLNLNFFRAMLQLEGDTRGLCAYKNLFVFKFVPRTSKTKLPLVPLRRFHLPEDFMDLLLSVLDIHNHELKPVFKKYVEEKWIESQEWKDLQQCMNKAQEAVGDDIAKNTLSEIVI